MDVFDDERQGGDFEQVHFIRDSCGLRAILAIHSTKRGPTFGGIRRRIYPSQEVGFEDALRLAEGMSLKLAIADLPAGGAKTVMFERRGVDRAECYQALGKAIDKLQGQYVCGPDVGTGEAELAEVRKHTNYVNPLGNDANRATADGVLAGLRGTLRALHGDAGFAERTFAVQGLGGVGGTVAQTLLEAGATVVGCDPDLDALQAAEQAGLLGVGLEEIYAQDVDVFVPCALGGILNEASIANLRANAVCGSANNQLATPYDGERLAQKGILYAPDFVVNVGAVAEGVMVTKYGEDGRAKAREKIAAVEKTLVQVFATCERDGSNPYDAAMRMAREKLAN